MHCVLLLMLMLKKNRIPTLLDDMAHVLRHGRDPMSGQVYDHSRFPTQGAYEPRNLHSSHPSHRPVLQLQFDLWKCRLSVFECVVYSDVEGMKKSRFRLGYWKAGMLTFSFFFFPKKASNVIATLLATWAFMITPPDMKKLANVSAIMVGIIIASYGEIQFVMTGFISAFHPRSIIILIFPIFPHAYMISQFKWLVLSSRRSDSSWCSVFSLRPSSRWTHWSLSTTTHLPVLRSTEPSLCSWKCPRWAWAISTMWASSLCSSMPQSPLD